MLSAAYKHLALKTHACYIKYTTISLSNRDRSLSNRDLSPKAVHVSNEKFSNGTKNNMDIFPRWDIQFYHFIWAMKEISPHLMLF